MTFLKSVSQLNQVQRNWGMIIEDIMSTKFSVLRNSDNQDTARRLMFDLARCFVVLFLVLIVFGPAQGAPVSFTSLSVCPVDRIGTPATLLPYVGQDHSGFSIELEADQISSPKPDVLTLVGNASAVQGSQAVYADRMVFSRKDRDIEAAGGVVMYTIEGERITADLLQFDLETRVGRAENVYFQKPISDHSIPRCPNQGCLAENTNNQSNVSGAQVLMRGYAERTYFEGHDRERHENVKISRCIEGDNSVVLAASQIILDRSTGEATGRDLRVRFFDIPIFYFPTVTFPIGDDRKTGFLFPTVGFGGEHGIRLEIPYYWNIAPDRDATITTDYMSARGTLLRGQYRFLGRTQAGEFNGQIGAEVIPHDRKFGDKRYGWSLLHDQQLSEHWRGQLDLGYASDRNYLDDFGDTLGVESADHVPQKARLEYQRSDQLLPGDNFELGVLFSDFQIIDSLIDEEGQPYARLPEFKLGWHPRTVGGLLESDIDAVWTRFDHPIAARSAGDRLNLRPSVKLRVARDYGFLRPQLDLDVISYRLDRLSDGEAQQSRSVVPVFSVDSGLALEREVNWQDQLWLQTLEPRLFYAFAPFVDQDDQPIFDDEEFGLNTSSKYFLPNRFHRSDRVGDTNRISIGLESRMIESVSGKQQVKAELAQMFYLSKRKVRKVRGAEPLTDRYSDLYSGVDLNLTDDLFTSADAVWSWKERQVSSSDIRLEYKNSQGQYGLSHTFIREESKNQLNGEFVWFVAPRWWASLNQTYSLEASNWGGSDFSLGYDGCCWAMQFQVSGDPKVEFTFKLKLKGLGGVTSGTVEEIFSGLGFD
jgi:LPS-assembly protein